MFTFQNFVSDFTGTTQEGIFSGNDAILLNEAISEHLLRQGHINVADMLIKVGFVTKIYLENIISLMVHATRDVGTGRGGGWH